LDECDHFDEARSKEVWVVVDGTFAESVGCFTKDTLGTVRFGSNELRNSGVNVVGVVVFILGILSEFIDATLEGIGRGDFGCILPGSRPKTIIGTTIITKGGLEGRLLCGTVRIFKIRVKSDG
jgi:hypothetical protein